ncbi:MAG: LysM peptidoglycan-binding domain-containing protein [Fibrobacter sp.]|nr:LysM peptidoglycan-binding domain-containing protein [Fibrobacter sp.]
MGKINGSKILAIAVTFLAANSYAESPEGQTVQSSHDEKYIIKKDDTLWDLADTFLGDSYKWSELWDNNSYINDPNLIFTGDPLSVPGHELNTPQPEKIDTLVFSPDEFSSFDSDSEDSITDISAPEDGGQDEITELLGSLRRKNVLSEKFFSQVPFLWTEKDSQGKVCPGNGIVEEKENGQMFFILDNITAELLKGAKYKIDDTLDIIKSIKMVRINGKSANLVKRTGRAKVTGVFSNKVEAKLFEMWDVISGKERIAPKQKFFAKDALIDSLVEPGIKIKGKISLRVEESVCPIPYQTLILDKGAADNVKLGDIFAVYEFAGKKTTETLSLIGYVASLTSNSSSVVILTISNENVQPGSNAALIWRSVLTEG